MTQQILQLLADSDQKDEEELKNLSTIHECARNFLDLNPGTISGDNSAIKGLDGFIFVHDGTNNWSDQINGNYFLNEDSINFFNLNIDKIRSLLGVDFSFLVIPEKDIIYPEKNPLVISANSPRFINAINFQATDLYPNEILKNKIFRTFHKRNSHYNLLGGYLVFSSLMNIIGLSIQEHLDIIKPKLASWPDDLGNKFCDKLITERKILDVCSFERIEANPGGDHSHVGKRLRLQNPDYIIDKKIIVFGDSYSWNPDAGLIRFMSLFFKEVYFQWGGKIDLNLVNAFNPDKIILEIAERFLPNCIYSKCYI